MLQLRSDTPRPHDRAVVVAGPADERWMLVEARRRDRFLVWLRAPALDEALARGRATEHDRLHALRAAALVRPATRDTLAHGWERVLDDAHRPATGRSSRVPIRRDRVRAAADGIADLVAALRAPGPVPARGVALASVLLSDGRGPLYDPRSPVDLGSAVQDAARLLDPATEVLDR